MKKKVLWVTLIVIIAGLTSCYGGKEKTIDSPTENLSGVNEDTLPENIANEIEEDEKISQDLVAENIASAEEKSTEEESPIEVYHDPDLDVKYSEDGKVVLRYQDQELDITDKFGLVSDSGDDCRVYLLDRDGKCACVSVKYKYGCVALDDFILSDWTEEYHNYVGDDGSDINDQSERKDSRPARKDDSSTTNYYGTFYLEENGKMMIVPAELGTNDLGTNAKMDYIEGAAELSYELAEDVDIWLFYPVQEAWGAVVTREAFLELLKQYRIDCCYCLNDEGKIVSIDGIYYS